ncbi:hypothetical protein FEM48_Zijuj06G0209000 [Ziziphus jujuba var. spinosa]|uniref:Pectinesterase inhibitor domain-containing protein n=1 Tax=Ziziphus jujuba var. spinosa TaxID=714518 RepID=A0A978VBK2_ZIZJJ|nr:hypothetical protein FEM48_Zijuj06G0209000 [Ziziphus jujuba var. spinosa]
MNDFIAKFPQKCSKTDPNLSYNFCVASLQSSPESRGASNLRQLGSISIKLIKRNVTGTRHFIKELLTIKNKTLTPYQKACLKDCMELYSDAVSTIEETMEAYKSKHYADANVELSSVVDAATSCEDGFGERKDVVSPLTKRNKDVFQLSAISLSIINMLINSFELIN